MPAPRPAGRADVWQVFFLSHGQRACPRAACVPHGRALDPPGPAGVPVPTSVSGCGVPCRTGWSGYGGNIQCHALTEGFA
jgi:hypothetical protein